MSERSWEDLHRDARFRPAYPSESVVRFVARRLRSEDGKLRVLDHGCGAGRHLRLIDDFGHVAFGCDLSVNGLRSARSQVQTPRLSCASMLGLTFRENSFDAAISFGALLYNDKDGFERSVEELAAAVKPGGWVLVVTRTDDDDRSAMGDEIEPGTVLLKDDSTNEAGMVMHFLTRSAIDRVFSPFSEIIVDRIDHTSDNGKLHNSDWVIEARL